ncbi:MAG: rhodanese-like domain-containing protein [Sphingomonadaceae bacterium]
MIFGFGRKKHRELNARELDALLQQGRALVVDVREANEFVTGHIPGAINMPLSAFRASQLPDPGERVLVLSCAAGRRSAMALDKCAAVRAEIDTHLAGGFGAWRAAGLAVEI